MQCGLGLVLFVTLSLTRVLTDRLWFMRGRGVRTVLSLACGTGGLFIPYAILKKVKRTEKQRITRTVKHRDPVLLVYTSSLVLALVGVHHPISKITSAPSQSYTTMSPVQQYWLPGYGLSRHIVLGHIHYFLGPSASVRPYSYQVYRATPPTSATVNSL